MLDIKLRIKKFLSFLGSIKEVWSDRKEMGNLCCIVFIFLIIICSPLMLKLTWRDKPFKVNENIIL